MGKLDDAGELIGREGHGTDAIFVAPCTVAGCIHNGVGSDVQLVGCRLLSPLPTPSSRHGRIYRPNNASYVNHITCIDSINKFVCNLHINLSRCPPSIDRALILSLLQPDLLHIDVARRGTAEGEVARSALWSGAAVRRHIAAVPEPMGEGLPTFRALKVGRNDPQPLGPCLGHMSLDGNEMIGQIGFDIDHPNERIDVGKSNAVAGKVQYPVDVFVFLLLLVLLSSLIQALAYQLR